jgi:carboxy-cis,cis-muconate cyclase
MLHIPSEVIVGLLRPIEAVAKATNRSLAKASSADTKTRAIFVLAAKKPPYHVYGNPFYDYAGFGNVFTVNKDGGLESNVQNYEYSEKSAIHGMVFDAAEEYIYSADMWANKIWTHKKDMETGHLTLVGSVDAPASGDHPRWVEIHPSGKYLYALMEGGNNLSVYVIDEKTHMPVFTHITYPLIPPGKLLDSVMRFKLILVWVSPIQKCTAPTSSSSRRAPNTSSQPLAPTPSP